jgi:hypothetical protein
MKRRRRTLIFLSLDIVVDFIVALIVAHALNLERYLTIDVLKLSRYLSAYASFTRGLNYNTRLVQHFHAQPFVVFLLHLALMTDVR